MDENDDTEKIFFVFGLLFDPELEKIDEVD